jgi:nicotinamidase-related amidase
METEAFLANSRPFVQWMLDWKTNLEPLSLNTLSPEKTGIICVDIIKGFCTVGPLASPRINSIVPPIAALFQRAWGYGIRDIALTQDTHPVDAVEFAQFGIHCVRGTEESDTVEAFKALPFFHQLTIIEKNSLNSGFAPTFTDWMSARTHMENWIIVGDCTDLCIHQTAMHMRLYANQHQVKGLRLIIPSDLVDTYDMPVAKAQELGIVPHDAEFLHLVFLYHLMLNGIEIVREIL